MEAVFISREVTAVIEGHMLFCLNSRNCTYNRVCVSN